jgi:hypothetical protein
MRDAARATRRARPRRPRLVGLAAGLTVVAITLVGSSPALGVAALAAAAASAAAAVVVRTSSSGWRSSD